MARRVVLALDVDGVVLDATRGGQGRWQRVLEQDLGIDEAELTSAFFSRSWPDIVVGRQAIEPALGEALDELGCDADPEDVLRCWFEADFWLNPPVVAVARRWARSGVSVVLVTNQEHRRAAFLRSRLADALPFDEIVYSAELGCTKAEPAFFEQASRRLRADEVVFVDDDPRNVAVAAAAGWTALCFRDDGEWWRTLDDAIAAALA